MPRTPLARVSELWPAVVPSSTCPASSNTQYHLDRSPRSNPIVSSIEKNFLICFATAVLTFFIAGLLYLLRFKRVDSSGAYSLPSEVGVLIPSVNHNLVWLRDNYSRFYRLGVPMNRRDFGRALFGFSAAALFRSVADFFDSEIAALYSRAIVMDSLCNICTRHSSHSGVG
jgi:hypothetical protein